MGLWDFGGKYDSMEWGSIVKNITTNPPIWGESVVGVRALRDNLWSSLEPSFRG